ncbi:hypothetical protein SAMN04488518_11243 [Pseudovibrio ascidiaceicola]|uniref:Uncharacterized protein n=1 Tax=Pseudovibrio ascidiaceicola TaxID=285279 RepID=A0A1I4DNH2_9HYPH|nr:hypothetical protein [Pseudovibrio ascidiaceicola]SFK94260.1 hypothetical protein SAMN04488518_11243 [Pseudovibrio ascidiaceicola]
MTISTQLSVNPKQNNWVFFTVATSALALTAAIGLAYLANPNPVPKLHLAKAEVSHCTVAGATAVLGLRGEWNCIAAQ